MTGSGLTVESVTLKRGGLTVCSDVSLKIPTGEITVVLGANGAGKTTLLDGISGVIREASGDVRFNGRSLRKLSAYRRARAGVSYVEQDRSVFSHLTVEQNIAVVDASAEALNRAFALFPRLADKRRTPAGLLSGGEKQMLLIARALAMRPKLLLIDELSLGLAPKIVYSLMEVLVNLKQAGVGNLLVEQFAELALQIGDSGYVMERGRVVRSASCAELLADRASLHSSYFST